MKHGATKALRVGCILLAIFLFGAFALLPQPVRAQAVTATITVGTGPTNVAVAPNGEYAYVTNQGSDTVSVVSTATNTVTATVTVGSLPEGVAQTPNGAYAYVINEGSNSVSVISTATSTSSPTAVPTATPTVAPTPTIPEFPGQLFTITMVVFMIIVLSAVISARKRIAWKIQHDPPS